MGDVELIIALDFPDRTPALNIVDELGDAATFYKVGLELFTREGPGIVRELRARGCRIFLDLKLHDIPNTVEGAARAAAELAVDLLTVHATGGQRMISAAREGVEGSGTRILGVTVLTSLGAAELGRSWGRGDLSPADEVSRLTTLAVGAGAHGVVAAVPEAGRLRRELGEAALIVTPGIRLPGEDAGDQVRTATPDEAVLAGANGLVVGRPITRSPDPAAALARIRAAMGEGQAIR